MPKRSDLNHVLVIGSGPIVIGQACEFDYSGTQACRALRREGVRVSLINSNPATIMTDPEVADATYIEPITPEFVEKVIESEKPDAILPTLGGQTALNTALALQKNGVLDTYGVELIGADVAAIERGEDRQKFKEIVDVVGQKFEVSAPRSRVCHTLSEVEKAAEEFGLPVVIRPSFTMGGLGSGMAHTQQKLRYLAKTGLDASPVHEVLIEESVLGWKEFELELMRDKHDNVVVVCSIENVDAMGVHTGDSITVAPQQTLTDREYQKMRDVGIAILREVGVETGGCNIQFAINPHTGRLVVIEMNPRVSRSSALASKATGFPIAKIAALLALGYTLDEIRNDITRETPASFEPTLDYVVVKVPRFAFEKFPGADGELTTTMKSVGEAMALGRNFSEALNKALRSTDTAVSGFWLQPEPPVSASELLEQSRTPHDGRIFTLERALSAGNSIEEVAHASGVDPWFLTQLAHLVQLREMIESAALLDQKLLIKAKRFGLSDAQIAALRPEIAGEEGVRRLRERFTIHPVMKTVDTCAAEFPAHTPYHYATYDLETEVEPSTRGKVMILGSGPNRIGQGIEFDYSCVHAAEALRGQYETVMVNCNPETVSTDYDTSERLYFEPLTFEDVWEVYQAEHTSGVAAGGPGVVGVMVQLGGQTPLKLAATLQAAGVPIVGTTPEAIHTAEERGAFTDVLQRADLRAPEAGVAFSFAQAREIAETISYPVLVRPSYVLGGRGMQIVYTETELAEYIQRAATITPEHPVLVDRFLEDAIEIDVDAVCDGDDIYIGGVMEHIEEAGVHSGDSSCTLPPVTLGREVIETIRTATHALANGIGVQGLLNVQFAVKDDLLYVLEANPRASRTVPFVSKATGVQIAKAAARVMMGESIKQLQQEGVLPHGANAQDVAEFVAVKQPVLPFGRFRTRNGESVDSLLGPEMKSTGEVMGVDVTLGGAFAKSQAAAYGSMPTSGTVFVSLANRDKRAMIFPVKRLHDLGFNICATAGTAQMLQRHGVQARLVAKHSEAEQDAAEDVVDLIRAGEIDLIFNTPAGYSGPRIDGYEIRSAALAADVPCVTTVQGAAAAVMGIEELMHGHLGVRPLQEMHH